MESDELTTVSLPSLRQAALAGVRWVAVGNVATQMLGFAVGVLLTRLLTPDDFGLMGMVLVITGFALLFGDLGFGPALIQRGTITPAHLDSVFWLNGIIGVAALSFGILGAEAVARFYGDPRLTDVMRLTSVVLLFGTLSTVPRAILSRNLKFREQTIAEGSSVLVSGACAVWMAANGYGVYSLVAQVALYSLMTGLLVWIFAGWRPRGGLQGFAIGDLWKFSANLAVANLFNYGTRNLDNLLIGKYVGTAALGIYTRAYALMLIPLTQITAVLGRVMFPALSRIQDDRALVKGVYLRVNRLIALLSVPIAVGLFFSAEPLIRVLFGEQWKEAAPILKILCLLSLQQPLNSTTGWIYQSQGRTDLQLKWNFGSGVVTLFAFVIGLRWGVVGVATAYTVRGYLLWYPAVEIPGRLINLTFLEFLRNVSGIFASALVMSITMFGADQLLVTANPLPRVIGLFVAGSASYLLALIVFRISALQEALELIRSEWRDPAKGR